MTIKKIQQIQIESPYSIGTIIQAPTAPVDGGTWLECDGTGVSQSTYSTLFGVIGHDYLSYTFERKNAWTGANRTSSKVAWTGTTWVAVNPSSTAVYKSTNNGTSWSSATALPVTTGASPNLIVNPSTGTLFSTTSSTTIQRSTDSGTTWSSRTFGGTSANYYYGFNGNNIIAVTNNTTLYYSSDDGLTWAATTVWPTATTATDLTWTGSKWVAVNQATGSASTAFAYFTSTNSAGTSGWSVTYPTLMPGSSSGGSFVVRPGTDDIVVSQSQNFYYTPDAGTTVSSLSQVSQPQSLAARLWTGNQYLLFTTNVNPYGIVNGSNTAINTRNFNFVNTSNGGGIAWSTNWTSLKYAVNTSTNTCLSLGDQAIGTAASTTFLYVIYPSIDISTQFSLPISQSKSWIKAL